MSEWLTDDYGYRFPRDKVERINAMVAQIAPYSYWLSRSNDIMDASPTAYKMLAAGSHRRTHCQYCGQLSPDDMRGGCMACGGPRPEYKAGPVKSTLVDWRI